MTTERYLQHGLYAEAYARVTAEYRSVDGALHCVVKDCNIYSVVTIPDQPQLI